jgi:outer membrane lipoprotein-sorting protein
MKVKLVCFGAIALMGLASFTMRNTGEGVLKLMFAKYAGKWHHALTFKQTTERYRNDSLVSKQTWREAMLYPDKLRIDIEPLADNNTIIFRADSTYRIRGGQLRLAQKQENDLIFLLGGMYSYPFDKAIEKFKALGYDTSKAYEDSWKGKPVFVIGAAGKDEKVSQLWVDKADMYLVRMIKYDKSGKQEALFDDHLKLDGAWTETKVHFYVNDKLLQVESYYDCKAMPALDEHLFDPAHYVKLDNK